MSETFDIEEAYNGFIDEINNYIHDLNNYFHNKWEWEMMQDDLDC